MKEGRIVLDKYNIVSESEDHFSAVGYLKPLEFHIEPKTSQSEGSLEHVKVIEITDDFLEEKSTPEESTNDLAIGSSEDLVFSITKSKNGYFSIGCKFAPNSRIEKNGLNLHSLTFKMPF